MAKPPTNPKNPPANRISEALNSVVADTTQLGWYTFNTIMGICDAQGWTTHDLSAQLKKYFHVDGSGGAPCSGITPINGIQSMWCGQWATATPPWCGWAALPGYGNGWDQALESTATATTCTYSILWDSEPGYDYTYVEWWDAVNSAWVADGTVNGGQGSYDLYGTNIGDASSAAGAGLTPPAKVRFHFVSDGRRSDEDGLWSTTQGAVTVDDLQLDGGAVEGFESGGGGEVCGDFQSTDGKWVATIPPGYGLYSNLNPGTTVLQEDGCLTDISCLWGWFDQPSITNYGCGGWPAQGAVPYGPDANGLYINNEIWSPWVPLTGSGNQYRLQFLVYKDLPMDGLLFFTWAVRTRDISLCPVNWADEGYAYYGGHKFWLRDWYELGAFVPPGAVDIQIALGVVDMCGVWCGVYGTGACHGHAPLFDQVKLVRVNLSGPQWSVRHIDLFQDNFPEEGGIGPTDYARCDMAQDIIPGNRMGICPGDSLKCTALASAGFVMHNPTGSRPIEKLLLFVKVTDRFGVPVAGKNGIAIRSPDNRRYPNDGSGILRFPFVPGVAPAGWDAYQMDRAYSSGGGRVKNGFCADLMDLAGPSMPSTWHQNENKPANTGIFAPGDVIHYFLGGQANDGWGYWYRTLDGQGASARTTVISEAMNSPCEWSVLPDAGRLPGDQGDILYVDDADDRGGPAQLYFDWAFKYLNIEDRVDRFDILDPSAVSGNSLASRVKNVANQIIGDPTEIYQKILWNSDNRESGLMGDGGYPNGGSSGNKSDDFALCYFFLNNHPDNPGWAFWGDDAASNWVGLVGPSALAVEATFCGYTINLPLGDDQANYTGVASPHVIALPLSPWDANGAAAPPPERFVAYGGCPTINDFDVPIAQGIAATGHRYDIPGGPGNPAAPASVYQATPNAAFSVARFFLAGFAFNFISNHNPTPPPEYVTHLRSTLLWFENAIGDPVGIDPVAFKNRLEDNYPNPFNPTTTIRYSIAEAGHVTLRIYNAAGQLVRTLVDEEQAPKAEGFSMTWDGTNNTGANAATGVYFYKLTARGFGETKKMVLLK